MTTHETTSPDLSGRAIDLLRRGVFPDWWAFVPVSGKATYVEEWASKPLTREQVEEAYATNYAYRGLGVVTGEFSAGLIALDIDGPDADQRFAEAAGDGYEPAGQETTMTWTSGRPGRRQLFFRVPHSVVPELRHVKTLILRQDGEWHLGTGDVNRGAGGETTTKGDKPYEEVVLRFNQCQSVVPGSPHPSGSTYRFLQYNDRKVSMCPEWVMAVLRQFRKPVQWLSDADQKALDAHLGETAIPSRQIRGWFFKEEVQAKLRPRLADLIFNHSVFDKYGWKERTGNNPQMMSGCPWHGGESGTAFQYSVNTGCWDCKACGIGGDVLDFKHKIEINNMHAERPQGPDLERYVAEIATALGFDYPACAKALEVTTKEVTGLRIGRRELLDQAKRIIKEVRNPAEQQLALMDLADKSGLYKLNATSLKMLAHRDSLYGVTRATGIRQEHGWSEIVDNEDFIIPGLLRRPSQVMVHARGGVGKSEMVLALAKAVGRGESIKIRGLDVPCKQGRVLWFSNDQGKARLAAMLERQGIEENGKDREWFELMSGWRMDLHEEFREQVHKFKPSLIVMDSLGTMMEGIAKENEGDYADWIYQMASLNGDLTAEAGFPAAAIIWIHHNTKSGDDFRGSDRLMNAMDETWALRVLTEQEEADLGVNRRILTINKSRFDRGGDRLIVQRDLEFNYSISDMTPLVQKEGVNRTGDSTPETLVLALLAASEGPLTRQDIQEGLHARMRGEGRSETDLPSEWGIRKYLQLWMGEGLIEEVEIPSSGRGRPKRGYLSRGKDPSTPHKKSPWGSNPFQGSGSDYVRGAHKKSPEDGELTKNQEASPEGEMQSTECPPGIFVSTTSTEGAHKKSTPETSCAAMDPEDGGFFVSAEVSFRKGDESTTTETGHHEQCTLIESAAPEAPAPGDAGVRGDERGAAGSVRGSALEVVRRPRGESEGEGGSGPAAEGSGDRRASGPQGLGDPQGRAGGPVPEPRQELEEASDVGGEVLAGENHRRSALGADEPLAAHHGHAPDRADVPEPIVEPELGEGLVGSGEDPGSASGGMEYQGEEWIDWRQFG